MERLTWHNGEYWTQVQRVEVGYKDICAKLAAYEDTGLEPGEINAAISIKAWDEAVEDGYHKAIMELKEYYNLGGIDHFRELVEAEKDGRLVVYPKKKEMTEEELAEITGYKCPICANHRVCVVPGASPLCGETYTHFKPREESEAALRGEANGET